MLVLLFAAGLPLAQSASVAGDNASPEKLKVVDGSEKADGAMQPGNNKTTVEPSAPSKLNCIWFVEGVEKDPVTMLLNQEGQDLYGAAKYEPEGALHWNAVVVGSVAGEKVDLVIAALKGKQLVATKMFGAIGAAGNISGQFFQVSDGKVSSRGSFEAKCILSEPKETDYTPAEVAEPEKKSPEPPAKVEAKAPEATQPTTSTGKSYYTNVKDYADKILTGVGELSQIPIGAGFGGL
jgi:hypothetical protein